MEQIARNVRQLFRGEQVSFFAPKVFGRKGFHKDIFTQALKKGYSQARIDGKNIDLSKPPALSRYQEHVTLDEIIRESLQQGKGTFFAVSAEGKQKRYSDTLFCPRCLQSFEPLDPRLFSFNSKHGACPRCGGMGFIAESDHYSQEFFYDLQQIKNQD